MVRGLREDSLQRPSLKPRPVILRGAFLLEKRWGFTPRRMKWRYTKNWGSFSSKVLYDFIPYLEDMHTRLQHSLLWIIDGLWVHD